ncbi:MAG: hypothetical protein ABH844_00150 [Candidatus Omnitrophota bacterium]
MRYLIYKKMIFVSFLGIFVLSSALLHAAPEKKIRYIRSKYGIKALTEIDKNREKMTTAYEKETKNYTAVKNALISNNLQKGDPAVKITGLYGNPVIILSEYSGTKSKWLYKPHSASFFSKEKIYLIFDNNNNLSGWIA